ncbi:MAG: hypothetical protein GX864_00155, partial [Mollicutes bacterium]|nr:hypothetical protein [Mollicutes bacterium]
MIKKMFFSFVMVTILVGVIIFNSKISTYLMNLFDNQNKVVIISDNEYKRFYNYHYVKDVKEYTPYS